MSRRHTEAFDGLRNRPEMFVHRNDFSSVAAFVDGYNSACDGGPLCGFREWLALRANCGSNWTWSALVLHLAGAIEHSGQSLKPEHESAAIDALFSLFEQFSMERAGPDGLSRIFAAYDAWRRDMAR